MLVKCINNLLNSVTKICTIWFMCKKVSALFFLHFKRPTLKLTSCWSRLLWCSGIDAENWEFAKVVLATTTYFRTPIVLWVWTNSRGAHHRPRQEPCDTPSRLRIPTNGPIFEARKICTVVVCTHSSSVPHCCGGGAAAAWRMPPQRDGRFIAEAAAATTARC